MVAMRTGLIAAALLAGCAAQPAASAPISLGTRPGIPAVAASAVWVPNTGDGTVTLIQPVIGRAPRTIAVSDPARFVAQGCAYGGGFEPSVHSFPIGYFDARACETPGALAVARNAVWVARNETGEVLRLDPASGRTLATVRVDAQGWAMAADASGVWLTDYFGDQVVRVDAATDRVALRVRGLPPGPTGIAIGPDRVWVVSSRAGAISRLDPSTGRTVASRLVGTRPLPVVDTGDAVWLRDELDGFVHRIDPATLEVTASVRVGAFFGRDGVDSLAFDGEGVWACSLGLRRVNARTARIDRELPIDCVAAVYGAGRLWVVDLAGRLLRVDTAR